MTAAASDPESKGKVEALVRHLKANLPPEGFGSMAEANQWAERWCEEVNADVHSETRETPAGRLERERPLLRPLAQAGGSRRRRGAQGWTGCQPFDSAPPATPYRGSWLGRRSRSLSRVTRCGSCVTVPRWHAPPSASQRRLYPGRPLPAPTPPPNLVRALRPRHPSELAFLRLGPAAEAYLRAAAAAGTPRLHQQLARGLQLAEVYEPEAVQAALVRAREFGRFGWNDIRSILGVAGAAPPAKVEATTPMAVTGLPQVPQREMTSYRWTR